MTTKISPRVVIAAWLALSVYAGSAQSVDVCIYGATPAGVTAAIAAKQEGRTVLLVEPSRWVGGILGAGLMPKWDCPEFRAVGGVTKKKVFTFEENALAMRAAFLEWLQQEQVTVLFEHRLRQVDRKGGRIDRIHLGYAPPDGWGVPAPDFRPGEGRIVSAAVYIDASYEGDLMARAGVRYAIGRESVDRYSEQQAGVSAPTNWTPLDPYVKAGDPLSGLLRFVEPDQGSQLGAGDDYSQAYNFRFYVTSNPDKRVPFGIPKNYSPADFELVGRYVDHIVGASGGDKRVVLQRLAGIFPRLRGKFHDEGIPFVRGEYRGAATTHNYNRAELFSVAPLGLSRFYQDGDWAMRSRIWREHIDYLRGLHHFLSTDPRVPEEFRRETARLGLDRTMHPDTEGWPNQLYVRVSRRMKGQYILTHADVLGQTEVSDSIGLALYGVDTYPVRRYVARDPVTGRVGVATEGNMFIGGARGTGRPYPIPYRAIVPKVVECSNLIVPVCFSASYIAYASARMEPVFCVLGESAGVAAAQAIRVRSAVQDIDVSQLRHRLLERGQVLEWKP